MIHAEIHKNKSEKDGRKNFILAGTVRVIALNETSRITDADSRNNVKIISFPRGPGEA